MGRLTVWKFPLFQLLATFPRPPLSFLTEFLVILRLLGNPIGTLRSLTLKLGSCQGRANYWRSVFSSSTYQAFFTGDDDKFERFAQIERTWKAFALIVDSYDEWGRDRKGKEALECLQSRLYVLITELV